MASIVKALLSGLSPKVAAIAAAGAIVSATSVPLASHAQSTDIPADTQPDAVAPEAVRAVESADSPIGIAAGESLMSEAESAISSQNYTLAASKLVEARKALNDVSVHYQTLNGVFVGVDSRVSSDLRAQALEAAQVRDRASYQLAVVYRAQGRPDLAVPLLVEVVSSQQPTRELGQQAYQQLYELGFVGVAYDAPGQ
ncbi:MAG: hypothetical protein AAFV85_25565 [Cyanobacteria bacterium J06634_6]